MNYLASVLAIMLLSVFNAHALEAHSVEKDILFKQLDDRMLSLDLYLPHAKQEGERPLLVWIHGGAWKRGNKALLPTQNPLLLESVLSKGYAVAAVSYRLSGEVSFPEPVQDINDALNYLSENGHRYGIKADELVVMGRSAGGHLANLIGSTNNQDVDFYTKPKYTVKAVVSFFGPTDLLALGSKGNRPTTERSSASRFLGGIPSEIPNIANAASPINYITDNSPPFILLHGDEDKQVPLAQSELLKQRLDKYGVENQLFIEQGVGHSAPIFDTEKYVPQVVTFVMSHLPLPTD
ncbi:alpha/beta hydrolase fold domain-containing protein [Vibrio astriarenae]